MEDASPLSSETISQRVCRTLQDLAAIRRSLSEATSRGNGEGAQLNSVLELQLAAELKGVVDSLRELLWTYITALSAQSGRRPQEVLDWYKMELAVDMLGKKDPSPASIPSPAGISSTFEELITAALAVAAMHSTQNPGIRSGA